MRGSLPRSTRWSPLLMAFGLACALHGLFLSYLHLQRSRQVPLESLQSRDNTPELLQFSSQTTSTPPLAVLPLPKASTLPPPPANLLAPLRPSTATSKTKGVALPSSTNKPRVANRPKDLVQRSFQKRPALKGSPLASNLPASLSRQDWTVAVQQLRAFQSHGQASPPSFPPESSGSPASTEDGDPIHSVLSPLEPAQQEAYLSLWERARPLPAIPKSKPLAPTGLPAIEVRQIPFEQTQAKDLQIQHRQLVVVGDQVLLFWIDGREVWLFRSLRQIPPRP